MSVLHSSTPWSTTGTIIQDAHGNSIADVRGTNEQSMATAAHIVKSVNATDITQPLNSRELATVLHALRSMQVNLRNQDEDSCFQQCDHFDETTTPLTVEEIDALCERLKA